MSRAFWVEMTPSQAERMNRDHMVEYVEENSYITTSESPMGASWDGLFYYYPATTSTRWGLDRLDQPSPSSPRFDDSFNYISTGAGVRVYVVDTGVHPYHPEFGGRVDQAPALATLLNNSSMGLGAQCWELPPPLSPDYRPKASHGTAVASIIGGNTYGVARQATLVDARAFSCDGNTTTARVNKVLEWIEADHLGYPRVVNLSFGFYSGAPGSSTMRTIVNRLVDSGRVTVVAAVGNNSSDSWWVTPANSGRAIAVGASKQDDQKWDFSNYRADLYAPGYYVESASTKPDAYGGFLPRSYTAGCVSSYPNDSCTSGTSFAAPFVSGAAARYLEGDSGASRDTVLSFLRSESTTSCGVTVQDLAMGPVPILNYSD